jgi:hypothetical protein
VIVGGDEDHVIDIQLPELRRDNDRFIMRVPRFGFDQDPRWWNVQRDKRLANRDAAGLVWIIRIRLSTGTDHPVGVGESKNPSRFNSSRGIHLVDDRIRPLRPVACRKSM